LIFNSVDFVLFLLVVLTLYWLLPQKTKNLFLLCSSYFFYGYIHPWFIILIAVSTLANYFYGIYIEKYNSKRILFLCLSIITNLTILGFFKYYNFFIDNITSLFKILSLPSTDLTLQILLPIGISFYTFQSLGYTIDVYRKKIAPCNNIINFSLYVSFFPQLVAGPIERASNILPQIERNKIFQFKKANDALLLIIWGYFKKLVIADNVGVIVDKIFSSNISSFYLLWVGVIGFTVQIFADYSAYTDIARGVAKLFGIELMKNFKAPYLAKSPADFWKRWHISLSSWIKDYLYIPLGGSRVGNGRFVLNVFITMGLCGLWHGASWNFVLWGLYHALLILLYRFIGIILPQKLTDIKSLFPVKIIIMFTFTCTGWLIFREANPAYLLYYITLSPFNVSRIDIQVATYLGILIMMYTTPLIIHPIGSYVFQKEMLTGTKTEWRVKTVCATGLFVGILCLHCSVASNFIYFQF
jgi:alginate O-acetyltransferase complex protein AlgI